MLRQTPAFMLENINIRYPAILVLLSNITGDRHDPAPEGRGGREDMIGYIVVIILVSACIAGLSWWLDKKFYPDEDSK